MIQGYTNPKYINNEVAGANLELLDYNILSRRSSVPS